VTPAKSKPIHVVPNWGPDHATDGHPCWCRPLYVAHPDADDVVLHREPPE
jgi:hypothetical protein